MRLPTRPHSPKGLSTALTIAPHTHAYTQTQGCTNTGMHKHRDAQTHTHTHTPLHSAKGLSNLLKYSFSQCPARHSVLALPLAELHTDPHTHPHTEIYIHTHTHTERGTHAHREIDRENTHTPLHSAKGLSNLLKYNFSQ